MKNSFQLILPLIVLLIIKTHLFSQDPLFLEAHQIKAFINPALTGLDGSFTAKVLAKDQYWNSGNKLLSAGLNIEQSFPCSNIDIGIYNIRDQEGDGLLTSNFLAGNFVYTVPKKFNKTLHNFRMGLKFQWTHKSIDWTRLYFSDQLDPKYFITSSSDFIPPAWNTSNQINLAVGLIHKVNIGQNTKWSLTWGFSFDSFTNLFESKSYDSILRLEQSKNSTFSKSSVYVSPEFPINKIYKDYIGLKLSYIFQKQINLTNQQIGFEFNYRKSYTVGFYLNISDFANIANDSKSIIFSTSIRLKKTSKSLYNLGFQYMQNIGGLSQLLGQTAQISLSYNFIHDGCDSTPNALSDCPSTSRSHQILYENIWYSPKSGINK